ncbi:MAG: PTS sugar transporter subunit IIA [Gammaproteobacteria bacterium]
MQISDILSLERTLCDVGSSSKKTTLEILASLIASADSSLRQTEVFNSLLARERLGSTGLGHGIALPHCRLKHLDKTIGAFIKLQSGIDYDAIDHKPVDLLFALAVPEEPTQEHLDILAKLAELFDNDNFLGRLREKPSRDDVFKLLII